CGSDVAADARFQVQQGADILQRESETDLLDRRTLELAFDETQVHGITIAGIGEAVGLALQISDLAFYREPEQVVVELGTQPQAPRNDLEAGVEPDLIAGFFQVVAVQVAVAVRLLLELVLAQ